MSDRLTERANIIRIIEDKFFVSGQMDAQGHAAEKFTVGRGGPVLAMSKRLLDEGRTALQELAQPCAGCAALREQAQLYIDQREMTLAAKRESDLRRAALREALAALVNGIDAAIEHPSYVTVHLCAKIHGVPYTGPDFSDALTAARDALAQSQPDGTPKP